MLFLEEGENIVKASEQMLWSVVLILTFSDPCFYLFNLSIKLLQIKFIFLRRIRLNRIIRHTKPIKIQFLLEVELLIHFDSATHFSIEI